MEHDNLPFVSIIVPVYNNPEGLKACLDSLSQQTYPQNKFEVIVVDNGSDASPEKMLPFLPNFILTAEQQSGSYAARNKGIKISQGEIIGFTDSDCIPSKNWVEKGLTSFFGIDNCGLVAGKIEIFFKEPNAPTLAELYESVSAFPQEKYVRYRNFGATANIFTSREILDNIGLFNSQLMSGGDREWGERVSKAGYQVVYADQVCVFHPARATFKSLHRKIIRQTAGMLDVDRLKEPTLTNIYMTTTNWLSYILPSPRIVRNIWQDKSIESKRRKIQLFNFMILIKFVRFYESIRLFTKLIIEYDKSNEKHIKHESHL